MTEATQESRPWKKNFEIEIQFWATYSCLFALASFGVNLISYSLQK